ncbi:MAG TPA: serine/threonine-protein kinase [Planctomycetaceae bacterium]|nr:serine/threonine-protein kinase [Planctomycetaceae bacterium]
MATGQSIGPFQLGEKLGAGGMGVVYRARYTKNGQMVALKLLAPSLLEDEKLVARFQRELDVLKKLKHPNIIQFFGGGRLGKQQFYVMELIEGGSLADVLRQKGRLSWEDTIQYGMQVCEALQHAHENGIVHRDLKPGNLMLDKQGNIKLADFGLARVSDATAITAAGKTLGTFAYMAPEQISGSAPISPKTDLYALGCVLFEFLVGRTPFESESAAELFYQHLKKDPPRICTEVLDCPVWLETIVHHLLEKDPNDRPHDALAVAQALSEVSEKVAAGVGVVQHSIAGGPTMLSVETDTLDKRQLGKILKKKKKKKRDTGAAFYEQTWFLVLCLLLVVGGITYSLLPMSEAQLYARAVPLMNSDDPDQWDRARKDFIGPLQKRFPDGPHATEVQGFVDKIEMHKAERQLKLKIQKGRELKTEGERLFAEAYRYEQFQDRITALEKYNSLIQVLQDNASERPIVNLARKQIAGIMETGGDKDDRRKIVNEALVKADDLYRSGNALEARKLWESVVSLYGQNKELQPQVEYAEARIAGKNVTFDAGSGDPKEQPEG